MDLDVNNLKQFSIMLSVQDFNPTMLTLDLLKASGVIPEDWEPARPQVMFRQGTRIGFKTGVEILAQSGLVQFSESLGGKTLENLAVVDLAQRYTSALPNLNYQGAAINLRRFIIFESAEVVHQYIHGRLLNYGNWQDFGIAPMQASLNLTYTLEHCQLRLAINEAQLKTAEYQEIPGIVFSGSFRYPIQTESGEARLESLHQGISNWREDFATFENFIDQQFLGGGSELLAGAA